MMPYSPKMLKGEMGGPGMGQLMISAQQMLPNKQKQKAEYNYMQAMTGVTAERKQQTLNDLYAQAKTNFYQLTIDLKKVGVLDDNEKLLDFMIKSSEIRYKNGIGKIDAYYKAKAALGNIHSMKVMLQNDILQRKIALNTLMQREQTTPISIDTTVQIKDYTATVFDTTAILANRSDIRAMQKEIEVSQLQQTLEKAKLKPEFGIRFDHMTPIGNLPAQFTLMGMVKLPLTKWSSRMSKATIESLKWQQSSIQLQQKSMVNEVRGMAYGMKAEFETKKKQLQIYDEEIIPAYRRNYQTMQLAYEQNQQELFMLYDAWEKLYMIQLEYLDQLRSLLTMQAELDRILQIKE
jgi:outer membrane protein TolC